MAVGRIVLLAAGLVAATIAASVLIATVVIDDPPKLPRSELPAGVELIYRPFIVPARGSARGDAICPRGMLATGGGAYSNAVKSMLFLLDSQPVPGKLAGATRQPLGWRVRYSSRARTPLNAGVVAVCVSARAIERRALRSPRHPVTTTTATTPRETR